MVVDCWWMVVCVCHWVVGVWLWMVVGGGWRRLFMWKEDVNFPTVIFTTESSHEIVSSFVSLNMNHSN